jgi:NTP pyrophosphatase (non-canonical NTP hydrolase)
MGITLATLQAEVGEWSDRNFPGKEPVDPLLGAVEEVGELAHAFLKRKQGIRGTPQDHVEAEKDAVADTIIYLADFCHQRGYSLESLVAETWFVVKQRDWTRNKVDGSAV